MAGSSTSKIFLTGATGRLGALVLDHLLEQVPADRIIAGVRSLESDSAGGLADKGVELREADFERPDTLDRAFTGVDRLLLISGSDSDSRVDEHRNVIRAAERASVGLLYYTSVLHADASPLPIAEDHRQTEALLRDSSSPWVFLRNSWYTENYAEMLPSAFERGEFFGAAGTAQITSAARGDLAEATAILLTRDDQAGRIYELAGDDPYTLAEFVAAAAEEAGKPLAYHDLTEAAYRELLLKAGLPEDLADLLSSSDAGAARGGLYDGSRQLAALLGRPTTPYRTVIRRTLAAG